MLECSIDEQKGIKCLLCKGRIDGITSLELQGQMNQLIQEGLRTLVVNLESVNYISSAGLRVFLTVQKRLKKVGGEVLLYSPSESVRKVFELGGMLQFFSVVTSGQELVSSTQQISPVVTVRTREFDGFSLSFMETDAPAGKLMLIGAQRNLQFSEYEEKDVIRVTASEIHFATGLATFGENYEDYKNFFGEAVTINNSILFYPAVKRPTVDFVLTSGGDSPLEYNYLHGFGFKRPFRHIAIFESTAGYVELDSLVNGLFSISRADMLGIVVLAESRGILGMHLKRVPIVENKPPDNKSIFDEKYFPEWMQFSAEPIDIGSVIAGVGVAIRNKQGMSQEILGHFAKSSNVHFHGAIFMGAPLTKQIEHFDSELDRVLAELEVQKVQHILGKTRLSSGLVGITELVE